MKTIIQLNKDEIADLVISHVKAGGVQLSEHVKVRFNCSFLDSRIVGLTADLTDEPNAQNPSDSQVTGPLAGTKTTTTTVSST